MKPARPFGKIDQRQNATESGQLAREEPTLAPNSVPCDAIRRVQAAPKTIEKTRREELRDGIVWIRDHEKEKDQ